MKTKNKVRKSQAGCNQMIHKLREGKVSKADAYAKVAKKYGFGAPRDGVPSWFIKIWGK
jgi:hypothetical protein